MNREFIKKVRDLLNNMNPPTQDPLVDYIRVTPRFTNSLNIKQINMHQLLETIKQICPTKSTSTDGTFKRCIKSLSPLILKLVNSIIENQVFPENLKIAKIIPILKSQKPPTVLSSHQYIKSTRLLKKCGSLKF